MTHKDLTLEIKAVGEDGSFEGMLSVYNLVDYGNDLVEPGAFSKTINENGGTVPMLWQHKADSPIGTLQLEDSPEGLKVKGQFLLDVQQAKEAYALVKSGIIRGLSIGYQTVKSTMVKGVRHLKELKLLEGSVVTFPMNPAALISAVKSTERKADFSTELQNAQIYALQCMMFDSLENALHSFVWDAYWKEEMTAEEVVTASMDSIDQFRAAYGEYLPKLLDLYGIKGIIEAERKAGRRFSAASRASIEEIINNLQALLEEGDGTSESEAASNPNDGAATKSAEPDAIHSMLTEYSNGLDSRLKAA